jgi:lipoprotein-releasing system permease protein
LKSAEQPKQATETGYIDPFAIEARTPGIFLGLELAKDLFRIPAAWRWSHDDTRLKDFLEHDVIGQRLKVVTPEMDRSPSPQGFVSIEVEVRGIFKTGFFDFDLRSALTGLDTARILKRLPSGSVQFLEAKLDNPDPKHTYATAMAVIEHASDTYHTRFVALPWMALNPVLLDAVKIEKVVMASILTLVVLVAAFGIASTLVMTVLEKTREIGTLMALGTRRKAILRIFVLNGLQVGLYGTLFGVMLGLGICKMIDILQIQMPGGGGVYVLDTLPVEVRWLDVASIGGFALLASTMAGLYPAWKASRLHPVEALRYE